MYVIFSGPGWLIAVGVLWLVTWLRLRRLRARAVVRILATIVGQNLPLVEGLRAAAHGERGALRRILERLADRLLVGDALSTALRHAFVTCPGRVVGALQGAEQGGTLPSVLHSLAVDLQQRQSLERSAAPSLAYFVVLALLLPATVLPIVIFLMPKYRAIFLDFGVERMPAMTENLIAVSAFAIEHGGLLTLLFIALVGLCVYIGVGRQFLVRVPDRFQFMPIVTDAIAWHLPVLRRVSETRALARQLPILHAAIRTGQDLPAAARQAACVDANGFARRRLRRWAEAIEKGSAPLAAARDVGLPRPLLTALSSASGGDRLDAALEYLVTYYRGLLVHWEQVLVSLLLPAVVSFWAVCVGYVVVALYLPLRTLTDSLVASVY